VNQNSTSTFNTYKLNSESIINTVGFSFYPSAKDNKKDIGQNISKNAFQQTPFK